jgi:hypothetical protein
MPGPYIHISAMRNASQRLARENYQPAPGDKKRIDPTWPGPNMRQVAALMIEHSNFAALGAVGPDLFFFLPDFRDQGGVSISSVLTKVLAFLEELYAAVDPYVTKWEKYIGPISEDTSEFISRVTGGLSDAIGDVTGELSSILFTALEDFVVKQHDWFGFFSLGLNKGYDDKAYFWSDMLHYRSTSHFGRALWRGALSTEDKALQAYALGYVTHLATDVTGHAFVNGIAGGPYRQHWQRHHLVENHCDAFWYLRDAAAGAPRSIAGYSQYTESAMYFDLAFEDDGSAKTRPAFPSGKTLRENWTRKRVLDTDSKLPDSVANLLTQAMQEVFYAPGVPHPKILQDNDGRPSEEQVKQAYDLLFRFLKLTTVDGFSHEPPDPPPVWGNLDFPTPTDPGADSSPVDGGGGGGGDFWDDLLSFILAVVNAIAWALEVVAWLLTLPWAAIFDLLDYPVRYALWWALEMPLFQILKDFRALLVLTGYMAPMADEIATSLVQLGTTSAESFDQVKAEMGDTFGGMADGPAQEGTVPFHDRVYPHLNANTTADADLEYHHPWAYPQARSELGLTASGPYAAGTEPSVLFRDIETDPTLRDAYEAAESPSATDAVAPMLAPTKNLGDPVTFSKYLLWLATRDEKLYLEKLIKLPDWNLDSDRGYAYKCWDWNRQQGPNASTHQDPERQTYDDPCTWPSQSDDGAFNPGLPLRTHYVPGTDPGCDGSAGPPINLKGPQANAAASTGAGKGGKS